MHHTFKLIFPFYIIPIRKTESDMVASIYIHLIRAKCFNLWLLLHFMLSFVMLPVPASLQPPPLLLFGLVHSTTHTFRTLHIQLKSKNKNKIKPTKFTVQICRWLCGGHVTGFSMYMMYKIEEDESKKKAPPICKRLLLLVVL